MPPAARQSSVGAARRAVQKSHVPYRGLDPTVGRKTGISIQSVPRNPDGFEPPDQVFKQLPKQPPAKTSKKKSLPQEEDDEDDDDEQDEDGEMSMDVDSPVQNYSNTRPPNTPRTNRPISRTSEVDFDQVPSPRSHRKSAGRTAGPSRLANQELLDQDEDNYDGGGGDYTMPEESPQRLSFTEMDAQDDELEEDEEEPPAVSPSKGKGKAPQAREPVQEEEEVMDDDLAHDMDDVDMDPPESDEVPSQKPPAKERPSSKPKPKPPTKKKEMKENRDVPEGVRRSKRVPYKPLEWWRLEKVVFGRDAHDGPILVPHIKEIIRIPKEPVVPLSKKGRSRKRSTPAPNSKVVEKIVEKIIEVPVENPEEGWDDDTDIQAVVKSYGTGADVTRRIAFTAKMFKPSPAANNEWFFEKIFGDGDFMAAGQLTIPPKGRKPSKPTKDNTFIFFVIEGAVNLKVCETNLIIASGGMFMIPRGNTYFIENIADRDAKLFFTQARKMRDYEVDEEDLRRLSSNAASPARAVSVAINGNAARIKDARRGVSMNV